MTAQMINGKDLAAGIVARTSERAEALARRGRPPGLAAVLIGEDAAAESYANSQARRAESAGIDYLLVRLPPDTTQKRATEQVDQLNADPHVSGIMLHLPVPAGLDAFHLQRRIASGKDVEGVGAENFGLLALGRDALVPCTAAAAFECLKSVCPHLAGRHAVVIGRSAIVGKPLAMLLLAAHCTVTQCHTRTRDLAAHARRADVLVAAAGVPGLVGAEHVAEGAVVIDVGTHRITDADGKKKTVGDVRTDEVAALARAITPVPGGVGPVTVAMLLANTVTAAERSG